MAPTGSAPCSCPCCKKEKCTCTGEPGKDCTCDCCKHRTCSCGAQHQPAGGQQEDACKCPCCLRKSCTCKQPSDCTCSECPKHACLCTKASKKMETVACDCCCCKTGTTCCTEARHQQSCECRCCKEKTCACCKTKQAGIAAAAAEPASGKMVFETAHDSFIAPTSSSSIRSSHSACTGSSRTTRCACCQAVASSCRRHMHWNGKCICSRRHCRIGSSNHTHFCTCKSHSQCCKNTFSKSQCANNTYKRSNRENETMKHISSDCCVSSCCSAYPACCSSSCVPCCFVAPPFLSCGCASKEAGSYCCPPMQSCDGGWCCSRNVSSLCCCRSCGEGVAGNIVTKPQTGANGTEADQPLDKRDNGESPAGEVESSSSSSNSSAAEQHSGVEHLYARNDEFIPCVRCCYCWQYLPTRNVAVEEHKLKRQEHTQKLKYVTEQRHPQRAKEQQQLMQEGDELQRRNTCIIDPDGRLLLECKTKEKVLLRRMQPSDYPAVRALLPRVSRCTLVLSEQQIHDVLSSSVFYAWCCFTVEPMQRQRRPEKILWQAITQQHEVEKQHPPTQQQAERGVQQQQSQMQEGQLLQQEYQENILEYYREKQLVAYCELVLQPRLGRKTDGRLERVVVDEAFCGRGLASQMCAAVLAAVKEREMCGFVDLTVEKDEARHIYEDKLGFRKVETTVLRRQL